ncbi:MAG: hypothetical protein E6J00_06155 [Chloroflexi bacterium]|nr:MAG: hypothetical protein E6J00_06155 [Chloroflexota bacterium]
MRIRPDVRAPVAAALLAALLAGGCGGVQPAGGGPPLTVPQLKYRLVDQVGRPLFCGPPVVRIPTPAQAEQGVTVLKTSDPATFTAIVARLHLDAGHLSTEDELSVLQQAETLNAILLQAQGGAYAFDYVASRATPEHVSGTIDAGGAISLQRHDRVSFPGPGGCPICLAATSRIDTPDGPVPVTRLLAGMRVWTLDADGRRIAVPILRVGHTPAPAGHQVVRLLLRGSAALGRSVRRQRGDVNRAYPVCGRHLGPASGRTHPHLLGRRHPPGQHARLTPGDQAPAASI